MIRGTTPTLEFTLPFSVDTLADGWVTISQSGVIIIDKQLSACECAEEKLTVQLTQEETLKLQSGLTAEIQIRVRTLNGEALASQIIRESTERIIRDGVI